MAGSLLLQLRSKKPIHNNYLKYVIRGGLREYEVIEQHGIREGTNLMEHYINGVSFIHSIYELLGLSVEECTLLMSAFSIHDLNKLPWGEGKDLKKLIDDHDFVKEEIKRTGINNFFLQWEEYFQDILTLIRSHSGHHHLSGDFLIPASDKTKLGYKRLEKLSLLMKAADISDLSPSFTMDKFKSDILDYINAFGAGQFEYIYHSVSEHRGILTNVIHNAIAKVFKDEFHACPLFIYPCGTYYLKKKSPVNGNGLYEKIAGEVEKNLREMKKTNLEAIITTTKDGLKVNPTIITLIELIETDEIIKNFENHILKKKFKNEDYEHLKEKITKKHGINIDKYCKENKLKPIETDEDVQKGELIRAINNFIKDKDLFTKEEIKEVDKKAKDSWDIIFNLLEFNNKQSFAIFDKVYQLPYILGANYNKSYKELREAIANLINKLLKSKQNNINESNESEISKYLKYVINLNITKLNNKYFEDIFNSYYQNNHKQSCLGSALGKTYEMMKPEVPGDLLVQQFSNRLKGGSKEEPKRHIDLISKEQLFLEKINFRSGKSKKAVYFHFFPSRGFTASNLENLKFTIRDSISQSQDVILLLDYKSISEDLTRGINFLDTKSIKGFPLPKFSEAIANIITLPFYTGNNVDKGEGIEHFLIGLEHSLILSIGFNLRCIFTECPVPPFASDNFSFYYPDGIPFQLRNLIYSINDTEKMGLSLTKKESIELLKTLIILRKFERLVKVDPKKTLIYELCTSFSDSLLKFLYHVDHLVERKKEKEKKDRGYTTNILEYLENLIKRRCNMEEKKLSDYLSRLAELAHNGYIRGESFKRNSLLYPIQGIFDVLRKEFFSLDKAYLMAVATDKIFQHLSRVAPEDKKPKDTKYKKIEEFVKIFFELYQNIFKGENSRLFSHEKEIKSAYHYYLNKEMSKARKENKEESNE